MNAWWGYFLPAFCAGLVFGAIAGSGAFRMKIVRSKDRPGEPDLIAQPRQRRIAFLVAGAVLSIIAAALWHGPLGAADRFTAKIERSAREVLVANDAPNGVNVQIHHAPLTRQLILSGPGDDFQQAESARLLKQIPGVSDATWRRSAGIPLVIEGALAAILGFLLGLLFAYLAELRRRHNSQWTW
jgi:membrane protease YdiL (CAAX protease family)